MKSTIDKDKLAELREAFLMNGGPLGDQEILDIIGDAEDPEQWTAALKEAFPQDFPNAVPPRPAAAKRAAKAAPVAPKKLILRNEDGSTTELETLKETGSAIFVKLPAPKEKDEVTLTLGGQQVVVDINELLELPKDTRRHGRTVAQLLTLAAAAK